MSFGRPRLAVLCIAGAAALVLGLPGAFAQGGDTEVTVGSNDTVFSQNKQNEPALAVDANHPNVLVAGANDNIDLEACNAGNPKTCPFTDGVGVSGVYFSFDSGHTWTQPTYDGWTARHCVGPPGFTCTPHVGPIGTLPWYYENGLVSDGDPALAFGPRRGANGKFSWANGSRLYYANLTSNFSSNRKEEAFKGFEAIGVSRTDDVAAAAANDKSAWMPPVIASRQKSAQIFSDKEQIWADNASSSPFFGNVYICFAEFRGAIGASAPLVVLTSHDAGDTWTSKQVTAAHNVPATQFGQSGCTVRTDSHGVAYVFYELFQSPFKFLPPQGIHFVIKSFDGGQSWTRPQELFRITDPCFFVDPNINRCVEDGVAGARNDLSGSPSVDIANGAPTGADATNEIVDTWADGRDGLNREHVMVAYSTNGARSFSSPVSIEDPGDRGYYSAPGISPNGTDLYITYNAFTTPFQNTTGTPRVLVGVVKHASIGAGGTPTGWTTLHRGAPGDPRGSSQNNLQAEFLGDYVYSIATRTYGAGVWNDTRNAADCPAMDTYRQAVEDGTATSSSTDPLRPAPNVDCPPTFGNSDIFSFTSAP
jgi:hypothetical protein